MVRRTREGEGIVVGKSAVANEPRLLPPCRRQLATVLRRRIVTTQPESVRVGRGVAFVEKQLDELGDAVVQVGLVGRGQVRQAADRRLVAAQRVLGEAAAERLVAVAVPLPTTISLTS